MSTYTDIYPATETLLVSSSLHGSHYMILVLIAYVKIGKKFESKIVNEPRHEISKNLTFRQV